MRRAFFALGGASLFAFAGFVSIIDRYAGVDETQPAAAIVILGAGVYPDGSPSDAMRARMEHGLRLYEQGLAPLVVVSGGERVGPPAEAHLMREWLVESGVPIESIIVEDQSLTTQQNAAYVAPLLHERSVETILLVTSPFHQWRAERIFEEAGFEVYLSPPPDDPAEERRLVRPYFLVRESAVTIIYLLLSF